MSEQVTKIIDELAKRFGIVIDWTNQNIIPYLQDLMTRYINYDICINTICLIISIIVFILSIFGIVKNYKKLDDYENLPTIIFTISCFTIVISFVIVIISLTAIIQDIYIPEQTIFNLIKDQM